MQVTKSDRRWWQRAAAAVRWTAAIVGSFVANFVAIVLLSGGLLAYLVVPFAGLLFLYVTRDSSDHEKRLWGRTVAVSTITTSLGLFLLLYGLADWLGVI